jgi:catechol 2,3-dioxygenase-like lactoylglutathione lyase family enzyme
MSRTAVAFVATARPDQALGFYRDVLGLNLVEDSPFALVFEIAGTPLRVQKVHQVTNPPYTVFGLLVSDIAAEVTALQRRGVSFVRYPELDQDSLNVWTSPSGARVAWFRDPDGNLLSLSQVV